MKKYPYLESTVVEMQLINVLTKGLGRELDEREKRKIHWLSSWENDTTGVFFDLFKELADKKEEKVE
jgi:hypothetical protein